MVSVDANILVAIERLLFFRKHTESRNKQQKTNYKSKLHGEKNLFSKMRY